MRKSFILSPPLILMACCLLGLLEVWDFRTRFAPLMEWEPPPPLEALQRAAIAQGDDGAAVFMQLLRPIITDVRSAVVFSGCSLPCYNCEAGREQCPCSPV